MSRERELGDVGGCWVILWKAGVDRTRESVVAGVLDGASSVHTLTEYVSTSCGDTASR